MFTEKLKKMVRRQTELVGKGHENMTPEEKAELDKLNAAIAAATEEPQVKKNATRLTTMNAEEFANYCKDQMALLEINPDVAALALLKRNVEAVKAQKAEEKEVFAVELPVEKTESDKVTELVDRIAALEEKLKEKAVSPENSDDEEKPSKDDEIDKSITGDLATEAIDALIKRFTSLKEKMDAGKLTTEEVDKVFDAQWELRRFIGMAVTLMNKAAELQELVSPIVEELKKLDKDTVEDSSEENSSDENDPESTSKGEVNWFGDLAKGITPVAEDEFKVLKNASGKTRDNG